MSTSDLFQRIPTILIFCLTFSFLTGTVVASENSVGRIFFVVSDKDKALVVSQEGSATPKQDRPNWGNVPDLRYAERESTDSTGTSGSLAEVYLGRLAEMSKARKTAGLVALVLGTITAGYGASVIADQGMENAGLGATMAVAAGSAIDATGIWLLWIASRTESELDNVLDIADLAQRERAGHEALVSLANAGQIGRIVGAIPLFILSGYFLASNEMSGIYEAELTGRLMGVLCGALAVVGLVTDSPEQTALENYLEESKQRERIELHLGLDPSGGGRVALVLSF